MSTPIVVEGLTKRFGSFEAVTDVTFTAPAGAITALLGPSGSGKSTVLRMIAGLEEPTAGRIVMGDEELTVKSVQERRVGFVFQHYALFRHMTVADNVGFGLRVRKEDRAAREARVRELLELVHLGSIRIPGAAHLDEGAAAAAFVRPHDVHVASGDGDVAAVIQRVASLGWLSRVSLKLPGGETLVAHVPNDELNGVGEGDTIQIDLRNPKAFLAPESATERADVSARTGT